MEIRRDDCAGCFILCPTDAAESDMLQKVIDAALQGMPFTYGGRDKDSSSEGFCLYFNLGGRRDLQETRLAESIIGIETVHTGGVNFTLRGTTPQDRRVLGSIRDSCFFGCGIHYLGVAETQGKTALHVNNGSCVRCAKSMIGLRAAAYPVCDACAKICEHVYIRGTIFGGSLSGLSMGRYCTACGSAHPEDVERLLKAPQEWREFWVEAELGITIRDRSTGLTPGEIIQLMREHTQVI
jgi:hypothetical protein